MRRGRNKKNN